MEGGSRLQLQAEFFQRATQRLRRAGAVDQSVAVGQHRTPSGRMHGAIVRQCYSAGA